MTLLPAWAPNFHPLAVHFAIALLTAAVVVDLVVATLPNRTSAGYVVTWLYLAGAAAAVIAYFSGERAARSVNLPLEVLPTLNAHADWAFRTTWSFVFFTSIRLVMSYLRPPTLRTRLCTLVIAVCGFGALATTVIHGSRLVFEYGIGVGTGVKQEREMPE